MIEERMMKRRRIEEDIISELPDDLLCHILSFLFVKEAIVTSSLSRRWRFLWTMVKSLEVECLKPIMEFYGEVDIFLSLRKIEKITRFYLKCNSHDCHCCGNLVEKWVNAVIARSVEEVNISLCMSHASISSVLCFPALFTCNTIVTLRIESSRYLYIPSSVDLPKLKTLHLHVSGCFPFSNIRNLISRSCSLQLFYLRYKPYTHHSLELMILRNPRDIQVLQSGWFGHHLVYNLVIQSDLHYDFISDYLEDSWLNIVKANVYITVYDGNHQQLYVKHISKILRQLCNVEFLSLSYFRLQMDLCDFDVPLFNNLVGLRLFVKRVDCTVKKFLDNCPQLQVLEVNTMIDFLNINRRRR